MAIGTRQLEKITEKKLNEFLMNPQNLNSYSYARNNPVNNIDENGQYTTSEKLLIINHPIKSLKVNTMKNYAFAKTEDLFGQKYDNFHNNPPDAFRHAFWSALITKELGEYWAKVYTDAHESYDKNPKEEYEMDMHNNAVGREIGKQFIDNEDATWYDILEAVQEALDAGELQEYPKEKTGKTEYSGSYPSIETKTNDDATNNKDNGPYQESYDTKNAEKK